MIPDFAIAMLSKEPPSAAKCSSPIVVMTDVASPELGMTLVASRAPPNPACSFEANKISTISGSLELSYPFYQFAYDREIVGKVYQKGK